MLGTHQWAERLRWHRFHQKKKDTKLETDSGNKNKDDEDKFVKMPWYKPTERSAPKGDHALEAFIEKCSQDFLDISGRRKIRDNMTKGERTALKELRNLPLTRNAACRFADKSGVTVITSLDKDDEDILTDLKDSNQYDWLDNDPTVEMKENVKKWTEKWKVIGNMNEDVLSFINNIGNSRPAKCKPLIKTHKPQPFPHRLLLSGTGTPTQPLSKFIQLNLSHLTSSLPYQIIDTKEFLRKLEIINEKCTPLPSTACLLSCDVVSLYPSVDNAMGVPAVTRMLSNHPSPMGIPTSCIVEGLEISLNNNACYHIDGDGNTIFASPNNGTAMGPCHAPDYVDIFMGDLDEKVVDDSPIPLLTSVLDTSVDREDNNKCLNWSRFRDDAFAIIPNEEDISEFEKHLQGVCPGKIRWTTKQGNEVEYLDVKVSITEEGKIKTDVHSKNSHSYLPPQSCHPPSVFKGLAIGIGRRLRMICSNEENLKERIEEYSRYLVTSGWKLEKAKAELKRGAAKSRQDILKDRRGEKKSRKKKIAWVTTYDPRVPSKSKILKKNLSILYSNQENVDIFPKKLLIAADKRRRNIGEMYKPTIPRRHALHGPKQESGFFTCHRKCDTCSHSENTCTFSSPWDKRKWKIRDHLTCTTSNVVYVVKCEIHSDFLYVGSTIDIKKRWANHKSDCKRKKGNKCWVSHHITNKTHPEDNLSFLKIIPIEEVKNKERLLERELYWQANLGTFFTGGNVRRDFHKVSNHRIQFTIGN